MLRLLISTDWFAPGYKAGGPIRSCTNLAIALQDDREVYVLTGDRDLGDTHPYPNIIADTWTPFDRKIRVMYVSPERQRLRQIRQILKDLNPNILYLNSMFSVRFMLFPLLVSQSIHDLKTILIPRGMLRASALAHRSFKKKVFLTVFRQLNMHRRLIFHATDEQETIDLRRTFGKEINTIEIMPLSSGKKLPFPPPYKEVGKLNMLFVGRIHPIKNLSFLLDCLNKIKATIQLTLAGTMEDPNYIAACKAKIALLPNHISVKMIGEVPPTEIQQHLSNHHLFVLPTLGENYGHAIEEALTAGRPVLISDQTPWKNLEPLKAGWDIPLDQSKFIQCIEKMATMTQGEYNEWCSGAVDYLDRKSSNQKLINDYLNLFS